MDTLKKLLTPRGRARARVLREAWKALSTVLGSVRF